MTKKELHQFIVTGASTGGKSTFTNELVKKYLVQHVCIDPIIEGFEDVFPELGITHNALTHDDHIQVCRKFKPFIFRMIEGLKHDNFAIDGFRLPLADLKEKFPHLQYFVFGFPNTTAQNQLERCRKFDTENWTNEMTNEELLPVFNFLISESQELEKICREKDIPFFDTGDDYHAKIKQALALTK